MNASWGILGPLRSPIDINHEFGLLRPQVKENNYRGHGDSVDQLCWHPTNPDLFVTASGDKTIRIWDVRTTKCIATVNTKGARISRREQFSSICCALYTSDGRVQRQSDMSGMVANSVTEA